MEMMGYFLINSPPPKSTRGQKPPPRHHSHSHLHSRSQPPSQASSPIQRQRTHTTSGSSRPSTRNSDEEKCQHCEHVDELDPFNSYHVPSVSADPAGGGPLSKTPSTSSAQTTNSSSEYLAEPFEYRHSRRFLRDPNCPYPFPVDLAEVHRQQLRSSMLFRAFGGPFINPIFKENAPKRVLEIACGSGFWSAACHEYWTKLGLPKVSFVGVDIVPLAPDLSKVGMDWTFVQYDIAKGPLPFPDGYFDFIFMKDATQVGTMTQVTLLGTVSEPMRLLRPGGVVEIWDSDYIFRTLLPYPPLPPSVSESDVEQAEKTGTYTMSAATPFAQAQNEYIKEYNDWMQKAMDLRSLFVVPCAQIGADFSQEVADFNNYGSRRIAIPFGEVRWEREGIGGKAGAPPKQGRRPSASNILMIPVRKPSTQETPRSLLPEQADIRRTALVTVIQMIEALEPLLKAASHKNQDEWDKWWNSMTMDLLEHGGTASGECLEVGAWWAEKKHADK